MKSRYRRHRNLFWVLAICTSITTFYACNENPTQVGEDYLPENVKFTRLDLPVSELEITSGVARVSNASNQLNNAMLLGRADDGTIAHGLLTLIEKSDRLQEIDPADIITSELRLRTIDYRYGDVDARNINFEVVSMEGIFASNAQWSDTLINKINNGQSLGTYNGEYPDTAFISVDLSTTETANFLNNYFRLDTIDSDGDIVIQTQTLRTIALKGNGNMIGAFLGTAILNAPDSLRPSLIVTLADTVIALEMGVSNWITELPITNETGQDKIVLAGGAPLRTHIKFDLDSIPENAVIHSAELTLHIVPDKEKVGSTGDVQTLAGYIAADNPLGTEKFLADVSPNFGGFLLGTRPAEDSKERSDIFRFRAFGFVLAQWLRFERGIGNSDNAVKNNGLILALSRNSPALESATVDRIVFYGPDAPEDVRPQLRILYSTQVDV